MNNMKINSEWKLRGMNPDDMLKQLKDYIDLLKEDKEAYAKKLREYNKDEEIVKLKKEIERLHDNSIYICIGNEKEMYNEFKTKHYKSCGTSNTIIELTPTGIGTAIKVKCPICGEAGDITDTNCW